MFKTPLAVAVCLALSGPVVRASDGPDARASLKGIQAVRVVVEHFDPVTEWVGLTAAQVQTDIEGQLRKAGIRVDDSAAGSLRVVAGFTTDNTHYAYALGLEFDQPVVMQLTYMGTTATTWSSGWSVGLAGQNLLALAVQMTAREQVDRFINAFRAVNP